MQTLETDTGGFVGAERVEPVRVWIESDDGSIARGLVDVLSEDGAFLRLAGTALLAAGDDVSVRIAFSMSSPTLGAAARVLWIRPAGEESECEVEWTHSGPERERLASLVASLA
jgi:hypothetical protein